MQRIINVLFNNNIIALLQSHGAVGFIMVDLNFRLFVQSFVPLYQLLFAGDKFLVQFVFKVALFEIFVIYFVGMMEILFALIANVFLNYCQDGVIESVAHGQIQDA
jgi:hypothetical protein